MEDYTYNLVPGKEGILETHMLEICPSIADGDVNIRVNPLGLGNREDPARLVFTAKEGDAIASSLIDMGDHFRLVRISNAKSSGCNSFLDTKTRFPDRSRSLAYDRWGSSYSYDI